MTSALRNEHSAQWGDLGGRHGRVWAPAATGALLGTLVSRLGLAPPQAVVGAVVSARWSAAPSELAPPAS